MARGLQVLNIWEADGKWSAPGAKWWAPAPVGGMCKSQIAPAPAPAPTPPHTLASVICDLPDPVGLVRDLWKDLQVLKLY